VRELELATLASPNARHIIGDVLPVDLEGYRRIGAVNPGEIEGLALGVLASAFSSLAPHTRLPVDAAVAASDVGASVPAAHTGLLVLQRWTTG
jgi:hypothetical protein